MSRPLPTSTRSRHKPDVYPCTKGVAPPKSTFTLRAMVNLSPAWLFAACVACLALLSFLIASTFSAKSVEASPSAGVVALTPVPMADSSIPPVHTPPPSPAVEAKVEPAPAAAVKNKAGDIVLAAAKDAPEIMTALPPADPLMDAAADAKPLPEKAPGPDRALLEKPPVALPPARALVKDPDPRLVDGNKLGTRIVFLRDPPEAFKTAGKERKLVFFVHLSGNFEDDAFT